MQDGSSASTGDVLRQIVKERRDSSIAGPAPMRGARLKSKSEMKKARILSESGPLRTELEGARLCASLARMQRILVPIELAMARRDDPLHGSAAGAARTHRRGTCERDQTHDGSVGSDDVAGFHDESFGKKSGARWSEGAAL